MALEFTNDKIERSDNSEAFRQQIFNPGDRNVSNVGDHVDHAELLNNNDKLVAEIYMQADRIATAALERVNALPPSYQEQFWKGLPKATSDDPVYFSLMNQRDAAKNA